MPTEELPDLSEESKFNPELVTDVAQNLLSFLKSKATKEGHTYWLFRGKLFVLIDLLYCMVENSLEENGDIVKLYDLTSLSAKYVQDTDDANPFTLPVAILMYR